MPPEDRTPHSLTRGIRPFGGFRHPATNVARAREAQGLQAGRRLNLNACNGCFEWSEMLSPRTRGPGRHAQQPQTPISTRRAYTKRCERTLQIIGNGDCTEQHSLRCTADRIATQSRTHSGWQSDKNRGRCPRSPRFYVHHSSTADARHVVWVGSIWRT